MSRGVYLLGVGMALVALAFVVTDALLWEPGVTEANVRRIRVGMTMAEVEALLGGPPKVTANRNDFAGDRVTLMLECYWWGKTGTALVSVLTQEGRYVRCFKRGKASHRRFRAHGMRAPTRHADFVIQVGPAQVESGRVRSVQWNSAESRPGLLDRLRSWLGW
jgi:hypothetical protein